MPGHMRVDASYHDQYVVGGPCFSEASMLNKPFIVPLTGAELVPNLSRSGLCWALIYSYTSLIMVVLI